MVADNYDMITDDSGWKPKFASEEKVARSQANFGTILAIGGADFALIASDYCMTSELDNLFPMTRQSVMGCIGSWVDVASMNALIKRRGQMRELDNRSKLPTEILASIISGTINSRRLFPWRTSTILAGLDVMGKGAVYQYNDVGQRGRFLYSVLGSARNIMWPQLNHVIGKPQHYPLLTKERAFDLVRDCFMDASRVHTVIGDTALIKIITKDLIEEQSLKLR
ncbi:proteasome subunit beta type-1 [Drosophila grimshawi]|uniref:proteasome subunit beta type-1 n=1 Tax=Drosophila grimshawi TaxID=7222 RepID=UPI0013EF5A2F|nr:proteasome subunit beta type-1 [Drosophila grimshawi]